VRAYLAFLGEPANARSKSENAIFTEVQIKKQFPKTEVYSRAFFAYRVYGQVKEFEKAKRKHKSSTSRYGNAFRYGKYAVVAAVAAKKPQLPSTTEDMDQIAHKLVKEVLRHWKGFEKHAMRLSANKDYFWRWVEGFRQLFQRKNIGC